MLYLDPAASPTIMWGDRGWAPLLGDSAEHTRLAWTLQVLEDACRERDQDLIADLSLDVRARWVQLLAAPGPAAADPTEALAVAAELLAHFEAAGGAGEWEELRLHARRMRRLVAVNHSATAGRPAGAAPAFRAAADRLGAFPEHLPLVDPQAVVDGITDPALLFLLLLAEALQTGAGHLTNDVGESPDSAAPARVGWADGPAGQMLGTLEADTVTLWPQAATDAANNRQRSHGRELLPTITEIAEALERAWLLDATLVPASGGGLVRRPAISRVLPGRAQADWVWRIPAVTWHPRQFSVGRPTDRWLQAAPDPVDSA